MPKHSAPAHKGPMKKAMPVHKMPDGSMMKGKEHMPMHEEYHGKAAKKAKRK